MFTLERELRSEIRTEFSDLIRKSMMQIDATKKRFRDFKVDVTTDIK